MNYAIKLWQLLKPLSSEIEIYRETVNDISNAPSNYIVYFPSVTESPLINTDGKTILRQSNCEIAVFTSNHNDTDYFTEKVADLLGQNNIQYIKLNLGYLSDVGRNQVTFNFNLI